MLWWLLLAHFVADYPLQTNWIIKNKQRLSVLGLHALIHLGCMAGVILLHPVQQNSFGHLWPYLLLITAVHFLVDYGKGRLWAVRPNWVVWPYLIDQVLHIITIVMVCYAMRPVLGDLALFEPSALPIILTAFVFATYVWGITEKVFALPNYNRQQFIPRMFVRALVLALLLILANPVSNMIGFAFLAFFKMPYQEGETVDLRSLTADLVVPTAAFLAVEMAIRF
jgi:hypothetical protein